MLARLNLKGPRSWLEQLLLDDDPVMAVRAAGGLLKKGGAKATRAVFDALGTHPSCRVRGRLAGMIGKTGGEEAKSVLIDALTQETDPRVCRELAQALGAYRSADVADALITALEAEPETWQLQAELLASLGRTRDARAVATITPYLAQASWGSVVQNGALMGLASTRDPEVLPQLLQASQLDSEPRVRRAAALGLGLIGDHVETTREQVVERLIEMLFEPGFRPMLAAIGSLARLKHPKSVRALSQIHESASDGRARLYSKRTHHRTRPGGVARTGRGLVRGEQQASAASPEIGAGSLEFLSCDSQRSCVGCEVTTSGRG